MVSYRMHYCQPKSAEVSGPRALSNGEDLLSHKLNMGRANRPALSQQLPQHFPQHLPQHIPQHFPRDFPHSFTSHRAERLSGAEPW